MQEQMYTLAVDFSICGDLAYLSHQETLTMFQRALVRASVPLAYSKGFNPHPQLSIPFPRSVGTQSENDRICARVQLPENSDVQNWLPRIQQHLPGGCTIQSVQQLAGKCMFFPKSVRYRFRLDTAPDQLFRRHLVECSNQITEEKPIEIQRYWPKKRRYKPFDLSVYLKGLDCSGQQIDVVCGVSQSGTARVGEIMDWLQLKPEQLAEPVRRTEIQWHMN